MTGNQQASRACRRLHPGPRRTAARAGGIPAERGQALAIATHQPRYAFLAGLATAIGAGVSMAFSEGLSDTGDLTGRGSPYLRGAITGAGTFLGGVLHTLPFLIPAYRAALAVAVVVIALELLALAWIRWRFFSTGFVRSLISITLGGAIIATLSAALGALS
jgi:erythrin-vacuolar iron transport family protein